MIVEHDHLGVRPMEVMPADFRADVVGHSDATLFAGDVVDAFDVGRIAVPEAIADDEMFFRKLSVKSRSRTGNVCA